ncbi:SDR family NAD(P)-dependent oxidoreductase [Roseiarcaceae bacterium H3SJ34-1]|uniref:SDR family NAD(P)-dependent oxidoreductase n=1 Tax=Terripilifer ovatus TaxID=3032367 RepID=UPI003AB98618|nr:SDR family NAD(P)-dependent oxidoreductase [Roseiarcaceae bacterium H3SJ34-1]
MTSTVANSTRLDGKRIIITGGAGGIGRMIAATALAEGASIGLMDRDQSSLEAAVKELGALASKVFTATVDVLDPDNVQASTSELVGKLGGLDGIVCAAGVVRNAPFTEYPLEAWNMVIGINLTGSFLCAQAAVRAMRQSGGGSIVLISSGLAISGQPGGVAYVASKAGIQGLTRTLALELGPEGIRCNNLAPGVVETPMIEGFLPDSFKEQWAKRNPLGRIGRPDDIAPAACFFLSEESKWITGQTMHISGGNLFT